ncbi:MAG: glycoside hydrolase domain-containing protein, partial [Pseudomonadota bacterium]
MMVAVSATDPADQVNLLAGSFTKGDAFSTGNTMPLVGRPWGFNHWALQTNAGSSSWWFNGNEHEFHWIRCTHQPSPWIGDYGYFMFGPQMGPFTPRPVGFFEPRAAFLRPYGMKFTTAPDGMEIKLAPTRHGAVLEVDFPGTLEKRVCFSGLDENWETRKNSGGAPRFAMYVATESNGVLERMCYKFEGHATVKIGTSFISHEQARANLPPSFDEAWDEAKNEWNDLLGRVQGEGTTLYTSLYRALTFPRRIDEGGRHYSPYDGQVHKGVLVTDNGFWDT